MDADCARLRNERVLGRSSSSSGWLTYEYDDDFQVEVHTREVTSLPGGSVDLLCKVGYPIKFCQFKFPGSTVLIDVDESNVNFVDNIKYYGEGYNSGQCGVTIERVDERHNGEISCNVVPSKNQAPGVMRLIVAKAPEKPIFSPLVSQSYQIGDTLTTSCVVKDGRPKGNITWYLDDELLNDGVTQLRTTPTPESNLITMSQNITRRLSEADAGRSLRCVVGHIGIKNSQEYTVTAQINIEFKPIPREDPLKVYGIKIGENSQINVTIHASPLPRIEWIVDNEHLGEVFIGPPGRFQPASVVSLGGNLYNATLLISPVEREDTDRTFVLKARNRQGETIYNIKISTLEEPEGFDLGAGGIVGIVIAVVFLLVVVFLVIFAKATNRWCFGGGVLRTDIPDAGDSEVPLPGEKGDGNHSVGAVNPSHEDYIPNGNGKSADIKSLPMEKPDTAV